MSYAIHRRLLFICAAALAALAVTCPHAHAWNLPAPPMFASPAGPAPAPPMQMGPPLQAPSFGPAGGSKFGLEGGVRGLYTWNYATLVLDGLTDIDFIEDLEFAPTTFEGEIYAAIRFAPSFAFTYSFLLPRTDNGDGRLPETFTLNETTFALGTLVSSKAVTSRHRWEGELFLVYGPRYRVGPLALAELLVTTLEMSSDTANDKRTFSEFMMGIGLTGEVAPFPSTYLKLKGAWTFLQEQSGVYLEAEGRYFPVPSGRLGAPASGLRPYIAGGYRVRKSQWDGDGWQFTGTIHGPFATVGVVF